jgi:hypothetical protein
MSGGERMDLLALISPWRTPKAPVRGHRVLAIEHDRWILSEGDVVIARGQVCTDLNRNGALIVGIVDFCRIMGATTKT